MNIINNLFFKMNKPTAVIITGKNSGLAKSAVFEVLKNDFKIGKNIVLYEGALEDEKNISFIIKNSVLPLLVATGFRESSEEVSEESLLFIKKIAENLPETGFFLVNFDDENIRKIIPDFNKKILTFGFQEGADLMASDIFMDGEINFKINYGGSTVPVWMKKISGRDQIYAALAAASCGIKLGMNLIEISQALKIFVQKPQ
jgi:hypothetical protein